MRLLRILIVTFLISSQVCGAIERPCTRILQYISENLPLCGTLARDRKGFVYVDIDNDYICKLTGLIEDPGYVMPNYFDAEDRGAYISVIYSAEAARYDVAELEEVGTIIHFCIQGCQIVATGRDPTIDSHYLLIIESAELDAIRTKYGLSKPLYPFHITIGIKPADLEYQDAPQALDESVY